MMHKLLVLFFLLAPVAVFAQNAGNVIVVNKEVGDTANQKDLIDIGKSLFHISPHKIRADHEKKIYFSALPLNSSVPGGSGNALVTSTTAGTYLGPPKTTNLSSATFAPYWNLKQRFGLPLRTSIWLPNNTWTIRGDIRFLVYPEDTWGLGGGHDYDDKILMNGNYIRFYQSALKQFTTYFFAGLGYNFDCHTNIKSNDPSVNLAQYTNYAYGVQGTSVSSGISINLLYDTRNNSINPMPGYYANLVLRENPTFMGSDNNWYSAYLDVRRYVSMNPSKPEEQNTLAFWSYFWTVFDSKAPYLDLPAIGWDPYNRSGEGIDQSRYRGQDLFYLESEYRKDITANGLLGFVVFTSVTTVSGSGGFFTSWHPAAGTGLRIKFNKRSKTNIALDYAFSPGYRNITLGLGESF